jgi:hypothetical protein
MAAWPTWTGANKEERDWHFYTRHEGEIYDLYVNRTSLSPRPHARDYYVHLSNATGKKDVNIRIPARTEHELIAKWGHVLGAFPDILQDYEQNKAAYSYTERPGRENLPSHLR